MTALAVEHLTKRYGLVAAVNDVSFEVPEGQLLALLGPNGAGKTTTMDMVLGLTRPDAGRVTLFGKSPAQAIAAGTVGGMLQTGAVIEYLSVRELITMVASLYPHPLPVNDVLDLVGIAELADHRTNKLSGGQAQRVRFALALIGVTKVERRGDAVILSCADSDSALWELHHQFPDAHDIEVRGMGIEDAFLALTDDHITGAQRAN
jgi:ABC-2 type transport system ATP-binding protein